MLQVRVKILYNKKIKGNYFYLVLRAPKIAKESLPGQFLNIKVNDTYEPLLRRPVSIHIVKGANIELLYEVVGKATEILSRRKTGEYLDVIGPLGNGFSYQSQARSQNSQVLVAGGMGIAPLIFLAEKLLKPRVSRHKSEVVVLIGAKTKDQILCEKELKNLGCEVKIATDDGTKGFKGKVTMLLEAILASRFTLHASRFQRAACSVQPVAMTIYACGPKPMLKEIAKISKKHTIPAQLSLEEHMACGIGACLGCVVNTKEGFKRVCKEGPVFDGDGIIW